MKIKIKPLRNNEPVAVSALLQLCNRCANIGARSMGAPEFAEDVAQEMYLYVMDTLLDVYDEEQNIEPRLIEYARRTTQRMKFKARRGREVPSEWLEEAPSEEDSMERLLEQEEAEARAEAAKRALHQKMRTSGDAPAQATTVPPPAPEPARQPTVNRLERWRLKNQARPDVQELEKGRRRIGLTHEQLARLLGVSVHHMRGVLYGRVVGDSRSLLERFRAYEIREVAKMQHPDAAITPIHIQLERWRSQLGLEDDPGWHLTLADIIGIRRATMSRWQKGISQPYPHSMRMMDIRVEKICQDLHGVELPETEDGPESHREPSQEPVIRADHLFAFKGGERPFRMGAGAP